MSLRTSFHLLCLVLAALPGTLTAADDEEVPLKFTRLDLTDGRKLRNVVVKSYDAKSEKLLLIADGKAMTIPIAFLPPPFNVQLKGAPASGGSVSTLSTPPRSLASAADQYTLERAIPTRAVPVITPPARSVEPSVAGTQTRMSQHQFAATQRAQRYYTFEYPAGSSSIEMTPPKEVPGWEGRCEAQGKAFLQFYDSKGRSYQRATSEFEVVTEQKYGEALQVVDFRVKR